MASKSAFSPSDLLGGAKGLKPAETVDPAESKSSRADTREAFDNLVDIYERHRGDLDLIFTELKSDPTKAKKPHNRPRDAQMFAEKYLNGFYDLVEGDALDTKADCKK